MTQMTTETSATTSRSMPRRVRARPPRIKKATLSSASYRLHQEHGESPATWENRLHTDYRRVALMNQALRDEGLSDEVARLMAPVDASVDVAVTGDLDGALHRAEMADCHEQLADETFREKLRRGAATEAEAFEYVKQSAIMRQKAQQAEVEVLAWIEQQRAKRGGA